MDTDGVMQLIALIILVLLSAFFSSAETSLTTVNRVRLKTLAEEGNRRAKTALEVLDKYGKMLSAILIGNNIVNLSASALPGNDTCDSYSFYSRNCDGHPDGGDSDFW